MAAAYRCDWITFDLTSGDYFHCHCNSLLFIVTLDFEHFFFSTALELVALIKRVLSEITFKRSTNSNSSLTFYDIFSSVTHHIWLRIHFQKNSDLLFFLLYFEMKVFPLHVLNLSRYFLIFSVFFFARIRSVIVIEKCLFVIAYIWTVIANSSWNHNFYDIIYESAFISEESFFPSSTSNDFEPLLILKCFRELIK